MLTYMSWSNATILYSPPLRRNRACSHASQTQLRPSPDRQESSRFCPRVFGPNRHFPQESALYGPQIRALLWAYRGPRATGCREESIYDDTCLRLYVASNLLKCRQSSTLSSSSMSVTSTCYIHIHELQLVNINCQRMFFLL